MTYKEVLEAGGQLSYEFGNITVYQRAFKHETFNANAR